MVVSLDAGEVHGRLPVIIWAYGFKVNSNFLCFRKISDLQTGNKSSKIPAQVPDFPSASLHVAFEQSTASYEVLSQNTTFAMDTRVCSRYLFVGNNFFE